MPNFNPIFLFKLAFDDMLNKIRMVSGSIPDVARVNYFILNAWCWFSYGLLINSNNVWIKDIIQICKIFARLWQFHFRSRCVTFCTNDERSWVRINYAVILQCVKILFFARFLRYLKICMVNPLMTFLFSLLGNMLHSDTPLIVAIITKGCRKFWEKNTTSVDFHFAATQIVTECFYPYISA